MTPLEVEIHRRIREHGPLGVDEYMALCLSHPVHGYYMAREPFGPGGDFVTAPEVSQMFGELLGAWAADTWARLGSPRVRLVELGPGRGTLMADALRVLAQAPRFLEAATLHLVETSPRLREVQAQTLRQAPVPPHWHDVLEAVPDGPVIVLANEFFDALPVQQWVRGETGWHERVVTLTDGRLAFAVADVASPPLKAEAIASSLVEECAWFETPPSAAPHHEEPWRRIDPPHAEERAERASRSTHAERGSEVPIGTIFEISPACLDIARALGRRVAEQGGAAIVVDYGHLRSGAGDTLQGVRAHAYADPLTDPGLADLTAHVDFQALSNAAREAGAHAHGPMDQGAFLRALGIEARAARLRRGSAEPQARELDAALERLTAPDAMGTLFKVLAIAAPGLVPAPFAPTLEEIPHA